MKNLIPFRVLFFVSLSIGIIACSDDDDDNPTNPIEPVPTGKSETYSLNEKAVPGISGTAKFIEYSDNSITVELDLQNTPADGQHPAHIHFNTAVEGGGVALTLGTIDGTTGKSSINFSELNDGTSISYDELLDYDGHINVHLSSDDLSTIVAQGDIGQNAFTGNSKSYELNEKAVPGISGTATFYERNNGEALAMISLMNTPANGIHPAHIHDNDADTGGGIVFTFNPIDGNTGTSNTNISAKDDGSAFGYNDVLGFNGHINVHLSADDLGTIVAQGNIGSNYSSD